MSLINILFIFVLYDKYLHGVLPQWEYSQTSRYTEEVLWFTCTKKMISFSKINRTSIILKIPFSYPTTNASHCSLMELISEYSRRYLVEWTANNVNILRFLLWLWEPGRKNKKFHSCSIWRNRIGNTKKDMEQLNFFLIHFENILLLLGLKHRFFKEQ